MFHQAGTTKPLTSAASGGENLLAANAGLSDSARRRVVAVRRLAAPTQLLHHLLAALKNATCFLTLFSFAGSGQKN